jgi:hypothetical protein
MLPLFPERMCHIYLKNAAGGLEVDDNDSLLEQRTTPGIRGRATSRPPEREHERDGDGGEVRGGGGNLEPGSCASDSRRNSSVLENHHIPTASERRFYFRTEAWLYLPPE